MSRPQLLLERDRELAEIHERIAGVTREEGSFLALEGRSGMGKTALLAEVRMRADAAGFLICSARASELEGQFAFGVVRQLFERTVAALGSEERAQAFEGAAALSKPVLGIGGDAEPRDQFAALHGLYWLAANLSSRTPLLLSVDDAHWADAASLRWLAYLLNRLEGLPILVAIATRPPQTGPEGEVLAAILAHSGTRILPVRPLGEGSIAAFVRTLLDADTDPAFTTACLRATAGNPLALRELLRELRAAGVAPTSAAAGNLETRAPDAITRRVLRDLSLLGDEAEQLARALAVMGDGTELRLIARLADLEVDRAVEAADELQGADLITRDRPLRFAHPLLRAAVDERLAERTRQNLHRGSAEILRSEGADPDAVAAHLLRCEAGASAELIEFLRAAAPLALRRGAPEAAVQYLRRALAEDAEPAQRTAVLAELGKAELSDGDPMAIGHLQEALTGTVNAPTRAAILSDLALAAMVHSDERASRDLFEQALEEGRKCDVDRATRLECIVIGLSCGDPRLRPSNGRQNALPVDRHYPRLRDLALGGTSTAELARVTLAYLLSWRDGNRAEALSWVGTGFGWSLLFDGRGLDALDVAGVLWSIWALLGIDDLQRAAGWCETVVQEACAQGHFTNLALAGMLFKPYAELRLGLLAEAEADAAAALEFSQQHVPYYVPMAGAYLADILFERGRQEAAYDVVESVSLSPQGLGGEIEAEVREIRGRLRWARGWRQPGVDDLRAAGNLCGIHGLLNPVIWPWRTSLATAVASDDIDEARELARQNFSIARRSGIPRAIGVALRTLARLDSSNAIDTLRAAVEELQGSPAPLDLGRALIDLGTALRHQGHQVEAREPLREALEIAARCGAVPLMERAQAEALAAGARPRRPRLRGVHALTPSELRVARLAAQGRSNREIAQALFITMNTVADHLGKSYSKLEIRSRGQLAGALEGAKVVSRA